jgi:Flp pilus assembly protein TadB
MLLSVVVVAVISALLFKVMNLWYVILVIALLVLYLMHYGFGTYLNYKLKRVYEQFPIAIQMFTDIYITNKSIKNALTDSYVDMPKDVGLVFERLARKLSSGHEYDKYIHEFADSLSYVWGYAFAELLLMSYEGSGDISNDLLFLNELMNDDLQDEEESKAEMTTNKTLFMVLNLITVIVFVGNIFFSPIAKELYFYTTTGNTIIMSWLMLIAFGISVSTIMENI